MDEGIKCDGCQQWDHCSCEDVSDELFDLYNVQDVSCSCLSCRHLASEDVNTDSMNSTLSDGLSMRDIEGDAIVSQSFARPETPLSTQNVNRNAGVNINTLQD